MTLTPEQEEALLAKVAKLETQVAAIIAQKDKYLRWDQIEVAGDMDYLRYYPTVRPSTPLLTTIPEVEEYFGISFTKEERQAIIAYVRDGILPAGGTRYFLRSILRRIRLVNGLEESSEDDRQ